MHSGINHFIFLFHVPAFFFISGFLEKNKNRRFLSFCLLNARNLILPYYIWNLLFYVILFWGNYGFRSFIAVLVGCRCVNAASWFLPVLFLVKAVSYLIINKPLLGIPLALSCLLPPIIAPYVPCTPFYVNLIFLFIPFYIVGYYSKQILKFISDLVDKQIVISFWGMLIGFIGLLVVYKFTTIPHVTVVVSFVDKFYLYWISGSAGILLLLSLSLMLNKVPVRVIQLISTGTLFIMCSHYEFLQRINNFVSIPNDFVMLIICVSFFIILVMVLPFVLTFFPILAGRKRQTEVLWLPYSSES